MRSVTLGEMIAGMGREERPMPLPEAQLMELRAALRRYTERSRFKVGDIVTPYPLSSFGEHGRPYIVLETMNPTSHYPTDGIGSQVFGFAPDLIIFGYSSSDHAGKVLVESHDFELWNPAVHREAVVN